MADVTATTTKTKDVAMKIVNPTEQQLQRYWDRIQRALQVLQKAQPHDPVAAGEMQPLTHGDWIDIRDVVKAIRILEGG